MSSPLEFHDQMKKARLAVGMKRTQLAHRLNCHTAEIGFWETGRRVPSDEDQRRIMAAIHAPAPTLARLAESLQHDVAERIAQFVHDAETINATPAAVPELPKVQAARKLLDAVQRTEAAPVRRPAKRAR